MAALGDLFDEACGCNDSDIEALGFGLRGWSVRHGRRRRLAAVMWGKTKKAAAVEAAVKGGLDGNFCQGRSVFKRSANKDSRHQGYLKPSAKKDGKSRAQICQIGWEEAWETRDSATPCCELALVEYYEALDSFSEVLDGRSPSPILDEMSDDTLDCGMGNMGDETCSTCASTVASSEEVCSEAQQRKTTLRLPSKCLTPWEMAVSRAQAAAQIFVKRKSHSSASGPGKCPKAPDYKGIHKVLAKKLMEEFGARLEYNGEMAKNKRPLDQFRWRFLEQHGPTFCGSLRGCFGAPFQLKATPLSMEVAERFQKACEGELQGELVPAFHGTNEANLGSIYAQGLVIPGQGNNIRVANGSAHGLGIYTAVVSNPGLSRSYARGSYQPLLVCGVLDSKDRMDVYNTGTARVIFDTRRVAPLFEAVPTSLPLPPSLPPPPRKVLQSISDAVLQSRRASKKQHKPVVRLIGTAAFLARRAARKRRGHFDFRNSIALQRGC